ncbi:MAG TPA: ROK family protein [Polyangiaceae bacterium]|nr:ROK family protein [Polyangiaceae bacterium]
MTLAVLANTFDSCVIGVHLRKDRVDAAVALGRSLGRRHRHELTTELVPDGVVEALVAAVRALAPKPAAVGLAIPGEMDGSGRCWGLPDFRGFDGVYLGEELAARLECPVFVESEGNAAAVGEQRYGHGRGYPSTLTVLIDERLSAGVVVRGEPHRGNSGFAAQIAHLRLESGDAARPCECGRRGCLNAHASLGALAGDYAKRSAQHALASEIVDRAVAGDQHALAALQALAESLGGGLALAQNLLDFDAIVLLCASRELCRQIEPGVRKTLRDLVYGPTACEVPLFEGSLGGDAVLVGAAALAQEATASAAAQNA